VRRSCETTFIQGTCEFQSKCTEVCGQDREVAEEPTADNVVVRAVQFEEKGFADLEGAELLVPAGLPEVDLIESVQM